MCRTLLFIRAAARLHRPLTPVTGRGGYFTQEADVGFSRLTGCVINKAERGGASRVFTCVRVYDPDSWLRSEGFVHPSFTARLIEHFFAEF